MTTAKTAATFHERLWPSAGMFIITVLFLAPTVTLVLTPINATLALPIALGLSVLAVALLLAMSPTVEVRDGVLFAGRAQIPVELLGKQRLLNADALKHEIGPGLDARSFLVIRGWIKQAIMLENIDVDDPAPFWIITSRRPKQLGEAIAATRTQTAD